MRCNIEWVETVELGANILVGAEPDKIIAETQKVLENMDIRKKLEMLPNPYGDGNASRKILKDLKERFLSGRFLIEPSTFCVLIKLESMLAKTVSMIDAKSGRRVDYSVNNGSRFIWVFLSPEKYFSPSFLP